MENQVLYEQFLTILKGDHEGIMDSLTHENFDCERDLTSKIQRVQARNCALFCERKIQVILNTINNSTVEDVADVIKAIEEDE